MINNQLLDYIRKSIEAGSTNEQIRSALLQQGWQQQEIAETFIEAAGYGEMGAASLKKRLANVLIDTLFQIPLIIAASVAAALLASVAPLLALLLLVFRVPAIFAVPMYYLFFETIWQKTPGKFFTKTKVAMRDGSKPGFLHILGRSFARYIPFEAISFLSKNPIGWHDKLSKTLVVPNDYTPEQIQSIDSNVQSTAHRVMRILLIISVLLIIVTIVAGILLVVCTNNRADLRDMKRIKDIATIESGLSIFYNQRHYYPWTGRPEEDGSYIPTCHNVADDLNRALGETFDDPTPGQSYMYAVDDYGNAQHYVLKANLENANNSALSSSARGTILGCDCTGSAYCFQAENAVDARDNTRINDLDTAQIALEIYYAKHGHYPAASTASTCEDFSANLDTALGEALKDPTPGQSYKYAVDSITNPQHYVIMAMAEDPGNGDQQSGRNIGTILGCDCTGSAICIQP